MLKGLQVQNFKAFNELQHIPLKPITLLYGPNSAGKSSIIQSLLLSKQSLEENETNEVTLLPKGKFINLGNYKEMVYAHKIENELILGTHLNMTNHDMMGFFKDIIKEVGFQMIYKYSSTKRINIKAINIFINHKDTPFIKLKMSSRTHNSINSRYYFGSSINKRQIMLFDLEYLNCEHSAMEQTYKKYKNQVPGSIRRVKRSLNEIKKKIEGFKNNYTKSSNNIEYIKNHEAELEYLAQKLDFLVNINYESFCKEVEGQLKNRVFSFRNYMISSLNLKQQENFTFMEETFDFPNFSDMLFLSSIAYRSELNSMVYLGPLREYPERHYIYSGISQSDVGKSGKFTPDLLFMNKNLIPRVNNWLRVFDIGYKMVVNKIKDNDISDVYSMRLVDEKLNISVSPLDVGFGISQILPIIVQGIISKNNIICIEQPEIHIHPKLQTIFGTFITECLAEGNQFIIETHSEHIMLRIQRLIREGKLSNDKVAVIYVDRQNDGSKCIELRLDKKGNFIDPWPNGFFEEGYEEVFS